VSYGPGDCLTVDGIVPRIDLRDSDAAQQIGGAAAAIGFLSVVNHGVDPVLIADQWQMARRFFDASDAVKHQVAMPKPGYPYGYAPYAYERLSASAGVASLPDLKETLTIGPIHTPTHVMVDPDESSAWSPNLWPDIDGFREVGEQYFRAMSELSARILSLMATALHLESSYFDSMIDRHASALRMINYPELDASSGAGVGQLRAGPHTDYGTITVLLADPVFGGLQVQSLTGEWVGVDAPAGGFVVNLGDAMARWTNDRWRSTMHRVVPAAGRRQSIAFFHNANWDAVIKCLPGCLDTEHGEVPRYEPVLAGPHLMGKFRAAVGAAS
jgi:isopenicillin N synthase-like dioxygenase